MKSFKHQGDIPLYPFKGKLVGEKIEHTGSVVIALGEATGHHHKLSVIDPNDLEIVKVANGYVFRLTSEGTLTHQEHLPITLAPGVYRSGHEREKDWFVLSVRRVID